MDHHVLQFATRGQCINGKKLDCFEHNHVFCFKLQCASIVVLLCTAIWWKSKDAVVHKATSSRKLRLLIDYLGMISLNILSSPIAEVQLIINRAPENN